MHVTYGPPPVAPSLSTTLAHLSAAEASHYYDPDVGIPAFNLPSLSSLAGQSYVVNDSGMRNSFKCSS